MWADGSATSRRRAARRSRPSASAAGWRSPTSTTTATSTSSSRVSDGAPVLLKNQGPARGNWIVIRAQGTKSNGFGLGATVRVQTSDGVQVREINNVASYLSANDIRLHVGLGAAKSIQQIDVSVAERHEADAEGRRRQSNPGRSRNRERTPDYPHVCARRLRRDRARRGCGIAAARRLAPSPRAKTPTAPTTSA